MWFRRPTLDELEPRTSSFCERAHERDRTLVMRDRDFGRLVFAGGQAAGILFLRVTPSTQDAVHEELARVLEAYSQSELERAFVVVEPGQYRIRRLG